MQKHGSIPLRERDDIIQEVTIKLTESQKFKEIMNEKEREYFADRAINNKYIENQRRAKNREKKHKIYREEKGDYIQPYELIDDTKKLEEIGTWITKTLENRIEIEKRYKRRVPDTNLQNFYLDYISGIDEKEIKAKYKLEQKEVNRILERLGELMKIVFRKAGERFRLEPGDVRELMAYYYERKMDEQG